MGRLQEAAGALVKRWRGWSYDAPIERAKVIQQCADELEAALRTALAEQDRPAADDESRTQVKCPRCGYWNPKSGGNCAVCMRLIREGQTVSEVDGIHAPECWCGRDENPSGPRYDIVCPKHDGVFTVPAPKVGPVEERLRQALYEFGTHKPDCEAVDRDRITEALRTCTCGFRAALASGQPEETPEYKRAHSIGDYGDVGHEGSE